MPTGIYDRKPCGSGCTCKKHIPYERSAETRARLSASKTGISTHLSDCTCGWCSQRTKRKGNPVYRTVHARLQRERGNPAICEHCGTTGAARYDWAYTGPGHEHGNGQPFSDDPDDYIRLCRSCHLKFDKAAA